ncbi:OmpA family protein [Rufibacter roseus]|uniref:OmpA family protein n=1 Tax=Rufibacter roseus TaxID=1567108 RepID=A0ABW2DJM0_9BACT|nr:OmpA family protein [Rufibacter roseus]
MKKRYVLPLLLLLAGSAVGQTNQTAKADKYYETYDFPAAASAYEKILKSQPNNTTVIIKLVQSYARLGNTAQVNYWLNKALEAPITDNKQYKELAALLAMNNRHAEAEQLYQKAVAQNDEESIKWQQAYQNIHSFYEDSLLYEVSKVPFNSAYSDFSPAFYHNGIVFSSARGSKENANKQDNNYARFIDLFYAQSGSSAPVPFSPELNSKYHEGPLSFNETKDTVYFTRSSSQQKNGSRPNATNHLKVYTAVFVDGKWQKIEALQLGAEGFSYGHPALAGSETLYFVSDMPGGFGGTDLYKTVKVNGQWQTPTNLGSQINTSGNEMFPFIDDKGTLYFASDGHPGLGGLDIFYAPQLGNQFGQVTPMSYPLNSPGDDFGLIIKGDSGYYNTNYKSAYDDLYAFKINRTKQVVLLPVDRKGKPLAGVQLEASSATAPVSTTMLQNAPAVFTWNFGEVDRLSLSKKGYEAGEIKLTKADYFRYNNLDTIRVEMPNTAIQKGNRKVQVALFQDGDRRPLSGIIELTDLGTGKRKSYTVKENGSATITLLQNKHYSIRGSKGGFLDALLILDPQEIDEISSNDQLNLSLKPQGQQVPSALADAIKLEINYDFNKAHIRPDAAKRLDKLVSFLKRNPERTVELSAHTDSRGTASYNKALSEIRAEAAKVYVALNGIDESKILTVGYGETRLKIPNAKTKAEHQENRRATAQPIPDGATESEVAASNTASRIIRTKAKRYYVIVGGFAKLEGATRKFSELSRLSDKIKIIVPVDSPKIYRLSVADFENKEDVLKALPILRKKYGNSAWILFH